MEIGKEKPAITIEPIVTPVPGKEPTPAPAEPKPERVPVPA
jgi:hypothetical protein